LAYTVYEEIQYQFSNKRLNPTKLNQSGKLECQRKESHILPIESQRTKKEEVQWVITV